MGMEKHKTSRRRRVLLLADFAYASSRSIASGTGVPVLRIPERCGSGTPSHFMKLFKARTGVTMLQWRRAKGSP